QVSEMVHPQYIAHDLLFGGLNLPGHHSFDRLERSTEIMDSRATGHFGRNRSQNIFGRECAVFYMDISKLDDNPRIMIGQHAEYTVIGSYEYMFIKLDANVTVGEAAGAVDRHEVNCTFWEFLVNGP